MSDILKVESYDILKALPNHQQGEIAFCEKEQSYYMYDNDMWAETKIEIDSEGAKISLYDLNKQIMEQLPSFDETQWSGAESIFADWDAATDHNFYMLYGKEVSYFTLFQRKNKIGEFDSLFKAVKECLDNVGDVHAFDITEDGNAIEIWVECEDEITCFYLFSYDDGVVTFNG